MQSSYTSDCKCNWRRKQCRRKQGQQALLIAQVFHTTIFLEQESVSFSIVESISKKVIGMGGTTASQLKQQYKLQCRRNKKPAD